MKHGVFPRVSLPNEGDFRMGRYWKVKYVIDGITRFATVQAQDATGASDVFCAAFNLDFSVIVEIEPEASA